MRLLRRVAIVFALALLWQFGRGYLGISRPSSAPWSDAVVMAVVFLIVTFALEWFERRRGGVRR